MPFRFIRLRNPFKYLYSYNSKKEDIPIIPDKMNRNYMEDSIDIKWEDTIEFTFPITGGKVIKVYDADTITIASKLTIFI